MITNRTSFFVEQNAGKTMTNLESLKGLIVVMRHICCSYCSIHISEVMGKFSIICCIHTNSYSDLFFITLSSFGFTMHF